METHINVFKLILEAGIVVKLVLLILIGSSIYSWAIILKKRKSLKEIQFHGDHFLSVFKEGHALREIYERGKETPFSIYKTVFNCGYEELKSISEKVKQSSDGNLKEYFKNRGLDGIGRALKIGANQSNEVLDAHLSHLATIGSVSPFVGLFGTVWGIIDAFSGIGTNGAGLETVAPGIAEALVATAIGLFAAIPAVWFFNFYTNKNAQMNSKLESFAEDFLNTIERSLVA